MDPDKEKTPGAGFGADDDPPKEKPPDGAGVLAVVPPNEKPLEGAGALAGAGTPAVPGAGVLAAVEPNVKDGAGAPPGAGVGAVELLVVADPNVGVVPGAGAGWEAPNEKPPEGAADVDVPAGAGADGAGVPKENGGEALDGAC